MMVPRQPCLVTLLTFLWAGVQLSLLPSPADSASSSAQSVPEEITQLLSEFAPLFQPPTELLPRRDCDHSIPLVVRAQPVFIRPYRYAPQLKIEIERQVGEMLQQGIIHKSTSAFASSILLVKKKDGT